MSGIVGIISEGPVEENKKYLSLMIGCMMHEPFYTSGTYINPECGLYTGWVCHKGAFSDCMPVWNEKGDIVLLFSGENFTNKDVTEQLKSRGHLFDELNASYLIHLYEEDEEEFFKNLNGWFSGIIGDLRKEKLVLFNDRYGMGRIYYHKSNHDFIFSSEAKSLLKIKSELRKIDLRSLGEYFICDCVLENRTLFSDIYLLPGGSAWTFNKVNNIKKDYYFKPSDWENQPALEEGLFFSRLEETFMNILNRYFHAKAPIAMSLTSGIDTRVIMSHLNNATGELPCYTFSGMYRKLLDARIARKLANASHQTHTTIRIDNTFFSAFPELAEKTIYVTDGCHEVLGAHDIYFNAIARQIAPIRITGKFGDEVLWTHSMLKKPIKLCKDLFHHDFRKYIEEAERTFIEVQKGDKLSFAVFKEIPWHEYGKIATEMSKLTLRTPYMDNDLVKLIYKAPVHIRASNDIRLHLIKQGNPTLRNIITDRGTLGKHNVVLSKIIQLFYYSLFKAEYVYFYQLPHWLTRLDYTIAPLHIERLILGLYISYHYRLWFRDQLSYYVQDILLDKDTSHRAYLNKKVLNKIVWGHIKGNRNYVNEINKALTVELIYRIFIENNISVF